MLLHLAVLFAEDLIVWISLAWFFGRFPKDAPTIILLRRQQGLSWKKELARVVEEWSWRINDINRAEELILLITDYWETPPGLRPYLQAEWKDEHYENTKIRYLQTNSYWLLCATESMPQQVSGWWTDLFRKELLVVLKQTNYLWKHLMYSTVCWPHFICCAWES